MRQIAKLLFFVAIGLLLCLVGIWAWFGFSTYRGAKLSIKFNQTLSASMHSTGSERVLDLRAFDAIEWDELVFWAPYRSLCDYGITGYERNSPDCPRSLTEGECYLVFLKQNQLMGKVRISRHKMDFTRSEISNRIPKHRAAFVFRPEAFPAVRLLE